MVASQTSVTDDELARRAEEIAEQLAVAAATVEGRADRRRRRRIAATVADPGSRDFLMDLVDQVLRIAPHDRAARRLCDLVHERGVPRVASGLDRLALELGTALAPYLPGVVVPLVTARLRRELSGIILPADHAAFRRHARRRARQGIRLNANLLGEAVLGHEEAERRTRLVCELLGRPEIDYVSVKVSAVAAQLDPVAFDDGLERVVERLRRIFAEAARHRPTKFVSLDMEEYTDLRLTVEAFTKVLSEPALCSLDAGIVLQAYLPDSVAALEQLAAFARARYRDHSSVVKVRLVKGANLAMESVEAELRGWPRAPLASKGDVDANYKRLLDMALAPENAGALRVGVASHNLFEIGWALAVREAVHASDRVEIEMLEGMANPQAVAVARTAGGVLLYAPVVRRGDFESAVAYLVRRFDENTSPENFLAHAFDLVPGSSAWDEQRLRFRASVAQRLAAPPAVRRVQDRGLETARRLASDAEGAAAGGERALFENTADTDFSIEANRRWLAGALLDGAALGGSTVAAVVGGEDLHEPLTGVGSDPSTGEELYRYVEGDVDVVDRAVRTARGSASRWRARPASERARLLALAADVMDAERGRTLAVMALDAGKTVGEGDPEISEAIDLARYYAGLAVSLVDVDADVSFDPYALVVVAPPWNFPYAIPAGGVFAALAAGSTVVLKPAPETVLTAAVLAEQCWKAGIGRDVLQFLPLADGDAGRHLVTHPDVDAVVLTGAWETARRFLGWRPTLALHGETSGKNALVITAAADQDDAIRDLVRSAFAHAGQKCSAASLAILEASLYDDRHFLGRLADAVRSLRVGAAVDPATQVGPLIRPPSGPLLRALTMLAPGERWLVEPAMVDGNPRLWRPSVKLGVAPGSELHLLECFGPVLGLMRADDLDHAIDLQNASEYGLTGGIHTLDEAEVRHWCDRVEVGNAYVNRHITGAIVQRQPFGGWKRSTVGPGAKAGGPHYVASLGTWRRDGPADVAKELEQAREMWRRLAVGEDASGLSAESNVFRLRPLRRASLRLGAPEEPDTLAISLAVAAEIGVELDVSTDVRGPGLPVGTTIESEATYVERITASRSGSSAPGRFDRVRLCGASGRARLDLLDAGLEVDTTPLAPIGRVELLRWSREQAISTTRHRHGHVGRAR
ncbi:MAG: putA [Acidimicrobiaceae bacterium]|nr:putA [Acidimicrobiaceae bacterium]